MSTVIEIGEGDDDTHIVNRTHAAIIALEHPVMRTANAYGTDAALNALLSIYYNLALPSLGIEQMQQAVAEFLARLPHMEDLAEAAEARDEGRLA
jgi:hypothetical protein